MSTITLYSATETEFTKNGLGTLPDALACTVTEERNGAFELEMVYPRTGRHWADLGKHKIIFCKPDPYRDPQPFEIYKIQHTMSGKTKVSAQHISYRLSTIPVAPFTASTCAFALAALKANAVESCPFNFTTDKSVSSSYTVSIPSSIRECLGGGNDSILEKYKGEYEWDNFDVKLWTNRGADRGVTIRYGKNMTDFSQEESIESTYTGIYPYWHGTVNDVDTLVQLTERVLYSSNASLYPRHLTIPVDLTNEFQDVPTEAQLRAAGQAYILRNNIGVPKVSMDVSFIALRQTEEYKNVAPLEQVNLCDYVTVIFEDLNVSTKAEVIRTVYDVLKDRYSSVEIGDPTSNLASTIVSNERNAEQTAETITSNYQKKITEATNKLKGAYGGHVVTGTNADGEPNEIFIMDTTDVNTATNVLRLNMAGIGFSQNGVGGPYSSAWLLDGTLDMQEINVIHLIGDQISAGIIHDVPDGQGNYHNWWNLTTGEVHFESGTIVADGVEQAQTSANEAQKDATNALNEALAARDLVGTVEDLVRTNYVATSTYNRDSQAVQSQFSSMQTYIGTVQNSADQYYDELSDDINAVKTAYKEADAAINNRISAVITNQSTLSQRADSISAEVVKYTEITDDINTYNEELKSRVELTANGLDISGGDTTAKTTVHINGNGMSITDGSNVSAEFVGERAYVNQVYSYGGLTFTNGKNGQYSAIWYMDDQGRAILK